MRHVATGVLIHGFSPLDSCACFIDASLRESTLVQVECRDRESCVIYGKRLSLPVPVLESLHHTQNFGAFLFEEGKHENDRGAGGNSRNVP